MYCLTFQGYGLITGSMGPVIPFLASQHHTSQTYYTFIFTARSIGGIIGYFLSKIIQRFNVPYLEHKIMFIWGYLCFIFLPIFVLWPTNFGEFTSFLVFGGGHFTVLMVANMCIIEISR